ncbi:hypothetical protein GQ44DRAFT_628903 [Phaeosphaeriaceae sp. PMI808]|nr:hypothetical protein GQ44DRAFT_628903 [Phaeosphaeriaceae sp. PMI808]
MNRWLTRKKDAGDDPAATAKKAKKGKKGQEEVKPPVFNLDAALPKVDDFRTSLIMPGLSTRFSMLREQDDPGSKIGKASDDSVIQPKRQSRLHEFGFVPGGLSDIAEVSSLNGSIRPPFPQERQGSFDSRDDNNDTGSMMSRARPGEGNILFGGRQKIYVISNSTKGLGRTLYDDDVNMSAYQKLRQEEKDRLRQEEAQNQSQGQQSEPSSPSASSRKRETSSSTNSATINTRTSTAATSIASQGANSVSIASPLFSPTSATPPPESARTTSTNASTAPAATTTTKARRLYDQGLDLHIQEQQSSAMNRLNSIQRTRAPTGRSTPPMTFPLARSGTNLSDRFNRGPAFRPDSPGLVSHPNMSRNNSSAGSSPVLLTRPQSPFLTSPVTSESDEAQALNAALQPNDRGKATAMGAFNKPKQAFSEQQYAERLRQMHREREMPEAPASKPAKSPPRKPTLRERAEQEKRRRADAEAAEQRRTESPMESPAELSPAAAAFSRFQAAADQMKISGLASPEPVQSPDHGATFLTSRDTSEDEQEAPNTAGLRSADQGRRFENLPVATGPAPPIFEHPALRSRSASRSASEERVQQTAPSHGHNHVHGSSPQPDLSSSANGLDVDSPTLGPDNGGLSGLIRQHLRNVSNVSSNYGEQGHALMSPPATTPAGLALRTQDIGLHPRQVGSENVTPAPSTYSHSNPWDLDDIDNPYRDENRSLNSISRSRSPSDGQKTKAQYSVTTPELADGVIKWDLTPKRSHERAASNETEADHEAFQRDLAQRQRVIQENLRARAEGLAAGPAPGSSGGLKTALNMLRAKSSRDSFVTVDRHPDMPTRLPRKLALGANSRNASSTSLVGLPEADQSRPDLPALRAKPSRILQQSEQDAHRESETRQRSGTDGSRSGRPTGRSPSLASSTRQRSGSGTTSGRSRSRPGEYRDDHEQTMMDGSRNGYVANPTPPLPADRPSLDSQGRMRSRSNSRTAAANYFESKHLQPIQTGTVPGNASPRLPVPKFSPGIPSSPRPSPGGYSGALPSPMPPLSPMPPYSASHTPPVSNPSTPSAAAFNPSTAQPLIRQGMLRKKSIAKSDISEPVFVSTTSVIDTVSLPPGASLQNGVEYSAPPVPPINPMRKRFGFGRQENHNPYDPAIQTGLDVPRAPYAEPIRTNSSDALGSQASQPRSRLRKTSSEGKSLRGQAQRQPTVSPALPQGGFADRNNSPPRPMNNHPALQRPMEGAMF